jgi:hypothetical protein
MLKVLHQGRVPKINVRGPLKQPIKVLRSVADELMRAKYNVFYNEPIVSALPPVAPKVKVVGHIPEVEALAGTKIVPITRPAIEKRKEIEIPKAETESLTAQEHVEVEDPFFEGTEAIPSGGDADDAIEDIEPPTVEDAEDDGSLTVEDIETMKKAELIKIIEENNLTEKIPNYKRTTVRKLKNALAALIVD